MYREINTRLFKSSDGLLWCLSPDKWDGVIGVVLCVRSFDFIVRLPGGNVPVFRSRLKHKVAQFLVSDIFKMTFLPNIYTYIYVYIIYIYVYIYINRGREREIELGVRTYLIRCVLLFASCFVLVLSSFLRPPCNSFIHVRRGLFHCSLGKRMVGIANRVREKKYVKSTSGTQYKQLNPNSTLRSPSF